MAEAAFGAHLRQCRQAVGLSLRQLATRVGYDHSYLSQVERGQRPGSAELARLCDRELGTGNELSTAFDHKPRSMRPADPVQSFGPANALEAAWHQLVTAFGSDWAPSALENFQSVPPAQLLPELITDLRLLQTTGSTESAVEAAELCVLTAQTLTALGQGSSAQRWWQAARTAADLSAESAVRSAVRAQQIICGLAERRPVAELLRTAQEALAITSVAPAHAAHALVLAELGQHEQAHRALQDFIGVAEGLPSTGPSHGPLGDWAPYEVHRVEGRVCASLRYGAAGCVLLARALELCPNNWLGERARLQMELAECLVVDGDVAAGVALALRVLVELPDEWHTYYLYDDAARVLSAVRARQPGMVATLQELLARTPYLKGRSVGTGSRGVGSEG
ncbi:helix-turn-helix domain-containing protein [Kribbella turkmenica]|uniref:Helix-turn-helix domain-containing protein n=1 Tax=Kribbella turkmenica TaxID=2530375 RepID=A0A4R4WV74_9ACTN|nr:helix-turn-helix domain-containing protein [Kribbella turkmenica]TDD21564.1 helix-turn-helix domain-containing protein [Kribbella turkmenica]